ncbi:MAG: D-2-hydroxyacid dehydrogenase [Desulfobacterales bacterium]|nr:D-2-hydroxyacid dehydrogenase [Desulfobacterales bacterium]MDP6681753.1 D-2-hydroxyacid dehydrogenase [Desulfobacterales bacterium]
MIVYFRAPEKFITQLNDISDKLTIVVCTKEDELKSHLPETVILITLFSGLDTKTIRLASRLKWIQALSTGVDFFPLDEIKRQEIILTNGRGIHKINIAEYAIAAMINLARNFHLMFTNQIRGQWDRSLPQDKIHGKIVGILGLGSIGQEIARKASMLGMHVIGVKYNPHPLEGVNNVYGPTEMAEVFKQSDYVINLLPHTPKTKGQIDKTFFAMMNKSACFINLGRGATVNQDDLINALRTKTIRALVSDVYEEEPLSEDNPLWKLDNVILTPHVAGVSPVYLERAMEIIRHNLHVYISRSGEMMNVVDLTLGY